MKLNRIRTLEGTIRALTGLHIGAGDLPMRIGGTDNAVIRHPQENQPYIPGSSLKGKVRALLELRSGLMARTKGKPLQASDMKDLQGNERDSAGRLLKLFGSGGSDEKEILELKLGPSRVSFSDCPLDADWVEEQRKENRPITELKSENSINRISGTATNPRTTERVVAGAKFSFRIALREFEGDEGLEDLLLEGLHLLELDTLGGSGSRGYGRIEIRFSDETLQARFDTLAERVA